MTPDRLHTDLTAAISGEVRMDAASRSLYSTDASVYQIVPRGVVLPRSVADVVGLVRVAAAHRVPLTARGGGTSQAGQAIGEGLVVDMSKHMNRVLAIDPVARTARVQPGVVLDDLNAAVAPHRLRFAPDVSSSSRATVGGLIANNSSGARSVLYGKTIDHVISVTMVMADATVQTFGPLEQEAWQRACDGDSLTAKAWRDIPALARTHAAEIDRRFPRVLRRVGGYNLDAFVDPEAPVDLSRIIVGSEGTLGIVVEATIRLVPLPAAKALLTAEFPTLLEALAATPLALQHAPAAIEVMDDFILRHTREQDSLETLRRQMMQGDGTSLLCLEFYGEDAAALPPRMEALVAAWAATGIHPAVRLLTEPAAQARVWHLRESALGLSMAMKGDAKAVSFVEDSAVAPERLRDYIARFQDIIRRHGTEAGIYAHASVGCLHVRPVINLKTAEGVQAFSSIAHEVADLVLAFGGALSGEHGDGLVRGAFNRTMFGDTLYEAFRTVKRTFDPTGLFNPGRIVDTPPITSHLRFGAGYVTPDPPTRFDYAAHGGFGRAVEMCSGVGLCRKTRGGTMCPSYMATRDEMHSTRGRANVLRLAMNGQMAEAGLDDHGVKQGLDLCLSCRACKSECPVGVDMGRYKSEFLSGYWDRHGLDAGTAAFARIHEVAPWASALAPLVNAVSRSAAGRALAATAAGIDPRRPLPRWSRRTLRAQMPGLPPGVEPAAVLFADTFTNHMHPEIGLDAAHVLGRAGLPVTLAPHVCCGRPLISQGLLDEARDLAARNVALLYPRASQGLPIVLLEPSCLSAIRDDMPDLLRGAQAERARVVARQAVLFESFLERAIADGRASLPLRQGPARISLHAHCHQRSMGLAGDAASLLRRIPGAAVTDLDAGCCGMAGSFGYTRGHFDVSQAIGERVLLPAARALGPDDVLVAAGTSCRHQVDDLAQADAVHPARLLRSLLQEP